MKSTSLRNAPAAVSRLVRLVLGSRTGGCWMSACVLVFLGSTIGAQSDKRPIDPPTYTGRSNPASFTDARLTVSTASAEAQFYSNGSSVESVLSLFSLASAGEESIVPGPHRLFAQQALQTLGIRYRADAKTQLTLAHHIRGFQQLRYGEQLVHLLRSGHLDQGRSATEVGAHVDAFAYQDFSFGIAVQAEARLRLGLRMHYLTGGAALLTERARITVVPSEDGRYFPVAADAVWHSSGLGPSLGAPRLTPGWLNTANRGYGSAFGAIYTPRPDISIGIEFSGIGHIRWHADAHTHRSAGRYRVRGIPYRTYGHPMPLSTALDQLHEALEVVSTPGSLRAALPGTASIHVRYAPAERYTLGGAFQQLRYRNAGYSALSGTLHRRMNPCWQLGLSLHSIAFDQLQVGLDSDWRLGPVRGFIGIRNVPALFRPRRTRAAMVRFGWALAFGEPPTD